MDDDGAGRWDGQEVPVPPASEWAVPGVPRPRPPAVPHPDVVALADAVETALALQLGALPDEELLETATLAMVVAQRAQLLALRAVARVQETGATSSSGHARLTTWLDALPVPLDRTALTVARLLGDWPQVDDAVADGEISLSAARTLQSALRRLAPHLDRPDGRIDGRDGETALDNVIRSGIPMLLTQYVGGYADVADPRLVALHAALDEIAARPVGQVERVEAGLLVLARHLPPGRALTEAVATLVDALLPDEHDRRVRDQRDRRGVRLRRHDDGSGWSLTGRLDIETGEKMWLLLHSEVQRDPQAPVDTALAASLRGTGRRAGRPAGSGLVGAGEQTGPGGEHDAAGDAARSDSADPATPGIETPASASSDAGSAEGDAGPVDPFTELGATGSWDGPAPSRDRSSGSGEPTADTALLPRTSPERVHDALSGALDRYLAGDLAGSRDKQPVRLTVTVSLDALGDQPGALPGVTGSGTRLPRHLLRTWACDAALTRHVLDLRGKVIATSHAQRTLTAAERNALHTQTGGVCQVAGCGRRSDLGPPLVPHHVLAWSRGGTTSLADTVLLCARCHHDVHEGHHTLVLTDGRRFSEDGWAA